jgi:hypothetical protein
MCGRLILLCEKAVLPRPMRSSLCEKLWTPHKTSVKRRLSTFLPRPGKNLSHKNLIVSHSKTLLLCGILILPAQQTDFVFAEKTASHNLRGHLCGPSNHPP